MSVTGYYTGNVEIPVCQALANTSTTKIGDAAGNDTLTLASAAFCNDTGGAQVCQLLWYDASTTTEHLVWQGSVANDETKVLDNLPLRLRKDDEIRAKGANAVYVTLVYILNFALTRA